MIYECSMCFYRAYREENIKKADPVNLGCVPGNKVKMINLNTILYDHMVNSDFFF